MAKRKKRNAVTLVSLLLALAALIGVYAWYVNRPAKTDDSEEATQTIDLATIDTTQISSLHYVKDDADLTLVLKDDTWISKEEPERPIKQSYVSTILSTFDDIKADRIIMEKPENLADYGLDKPSATLEINLTDGTKDTIQIGSEAVDNEGYYGLVNDDGTVYLLPIEMGTALKYSNTEMTEVESSPGITAENIYSLSIDNRDGEDYEIVHKDDGSLDNTGNSMYNWEILKPYGKGYSADDSKMSDIQANYTSFNYISCVDYKVDDLSKYGLDDPAATIDIGYYTTRTEALPTPETDASTGETVSEKTYYDKNEYKVYIGNQDEDGNYYIRRDGSDAVYTIDADSIDKMRSIDVFSIMNPFVLIPNIDSVDQITVDIGGTKYTMDIKRTTKKNDSGEDETVATYYYNGKESEESAFTSLYQSMISAKNDAVIKDPVSTDDLSPVMTISYHLFGDNERMVSASFLPYNDSFYLVQKDNEVRFFADKRAIDDIIAKVSQFTGKAQE